MHKKAWLGYGLNINLKSQELSDILLDTNNYKCKKIGKYYTVEKNHFGTIEKKSELEIALYV